jgi:hypothetical protein
MKLLVTNFKHRMHKHATVLLFTCILHSCADHERSSYVNEEASLSIPGLPFSIAEGVLLSQYAIPSTRTTSWLLADSGFVKNQSVAGFLSGKGQGKLCILHWSQTNDPVWIGARIPGKFLRADVIMFESGKLVIKQYNSYGVVVPANENYKKELVALLKEVNMIRYP